MTSETLVERLRRRGHSMASGALFNPDGPEAVRRIEADGAEITRLQEALAAAEARIAETRKKALEEAAQIARYMHIAHDPHFFTDVYNGDVADAIRSLSADEAQP